MIVKIFENEDKFIADCVGFFRECIKEGGKNVKIVLSGGNTPEKIYKKLSGSSLSFKDTEFFQVDERYVARGNEDSNWKLINETLLSNPEKQPKKFHFFDTALPIRESLSKYEKEIKNVKFDLVVLGIGTDGHTASLFPNSPALKEEEKPVLHTETESHPAKDRLTMTFPAILNSKKILVLLEGPRKHKILSILTHSLANPKNDIENTPALKLLEHDDLTIFHYL
jgi:6-phosphogluconolactonase